jgi:hypothetical protein
LQLQTASKNFPNRSYNLKLMGGGISAAVSHETEPDEKLINERRAAIIASQSAEYAEFRALNIPSQDFKEYSSKMKTGDILLFKCMCKSSSFLKTYQGCPYSHVGMIIVRKGVPYVFESSFREYVVDADRNVCVNGPMISQVSKRLQEFYGIICWRALEVPNRNDQEMNEIVENLVLDFSTKYYDHSLNEYFKAFKAKTSNTGEDTTKLFCSELVAECYQHLGLISLDRASNSYSVADFTESGYTVSAITQLRNLSPEDAKVHLLQGSSLLGTVILNPPWATIDFDITKMAEEDLHILSGVGISTADLLRRTNATMHVILDTVHTKFTLNDDGLQIDNIVDSYLKPSGLRVIAVVGELPFDTKLGIPHFEVPCLANQQISIPVILGEDNLGVWFWVYDDDLLSSDYVGMVSIFPRSLIDVKEKLDTPQRWKMQGGELVMYVWLTQG